MVNSDFWRGHGLLVGMALCCLAMDLSVASGELLWGTRGSKRTESVPSTNSFRQECKRNEDCPLNYCCTVGMMRYSVPTCTSFGKRADPCIPDNEQRNFSLSFPNVDESWEVIDSYSMLCPCSDGFYCNEVSVSCEPFDRHNNILSNSQKT